MDKVQSPSNSEYYTSFWNLPLFLIQEQSVKISIWVASLTTFVFVVLNICLSSLYQVHESMLEKQPVTVAEWSNIRHELFSLARML
jgi:hypothetical protein